MGSNFHVGYDEKIKLKIKLQYLQNTTNNKMQSTVFTDSQMF
jgi:hypothetical protein